MVGYPDHPCPVCKGPMAEQKESACSGRCRAEASRKRKAQAQDQRDRKVRRLLEEALGILTCEGDKV